MPGTSLQLRFSSEPGDLLIRCETAGAPRTFAALLASLPLAIDLHCPKIAGTHIYWHAPFVEDVEQAANVMSAAPGAFLFWPERQFLELVYAPLQAETASVTLLGAVEDPIESLVQLGDLVRRRQGHGSCRATLAAVNEAGVRQPAVPPAGPLALLRERRLALWAAQPAEIDSLLAGRGIMHPAGPLLFAESEARGLHELLWWHRRCWRADGKGWHRLAAATAADKAATRLAGFCHLEDAAAGLRLVAAAFADERLDAAAVFDEAILIAGRLSGWLDLAIPWQDLNDAVRAADQRRRPAA